MGQDFMVLLGRCTVWFSHLIADPFLNLPIDQIKYFKASEVVCILGVLHIVKKYLLKEEENTLL